MNKIKVREVTNLDHIQIYNFGRLRGYLAHLFAVIAILIIFSK